MFRKPAVHRKYPVRATLSKVVREICYEFLKRGCVNKIVCETIRMSEVPRSMLTGRWGVRVRPVVATISLWYWDLKITLKIMRSIVLTIFCRSLGMNRIIPSLVMAITAASPPVVFNALNKIL